MASFHWFSLFLILSTTIFVNAGRSKRSPIVTNDLAGPNEYRYAVAIFDKRKMYICSGGIIGEKHILSAAHPLIQQTTNQLKSDEYLVYAGTRNRRSPVNESNSVVLSVKTIFVPSNFNSSRGLSDIAILELAVNLTTRIPNLPVLRLPVRNVAIGEQAVVAAFGQCKLNDPPNGNGNETVVENDGKLRYANMSIVGIDACPEKKNSTLPDYLLLGKMIKHSSEIYGICYGDSGAALVQNGNTVIGVTMRGFYQKCDGRTRPVLFTNVRTYVPYFHRVSTTRRQHYSTQHTRAKMSCPGITKINSLINL